jgi:glycerate 2-kinase
MRHDAAAIFDSALCAVHAGTAVKTSCCLKKDVLTVGTTSFDLRRYRNIHIIGAGKASAHMGAAIEDLLLSRITDGIITVKYDHTASLKKIKLIEAGHPVPDENGQKSAHAILNIADKAQADDLIICLISGGGSALLALPAPSLTLGDKQKTIQTLLACGASIDDINTLRKHMSIIKGGGLAQKAYPATLVTLILSDVVGDTLDVIASGPTIPDSSSFSDCMNIITSYDIINDLPRRAVEHFKKGSEGKIKETPKPGDPAFKNTYNLIIGSNSQALHAARKKAEALGYNTLILSSLIEGDTGEAARFHTSIAKEIRKTGNPIPPPACILSGGETTVKIKGNGLGGRNQEFALEAAFELKNEDQMVLLSAGTDGTDGPTDAAGAIVDSQTIKKALATGLNPDHFLENNDSYNLFKKTDELIVTGPTGTNVMDIRIVLVK